MSQVNKISNQNAFTFLEVMVAMFILSIGLLGLASLSTTVIKNNSYSNQSTVATSLAQDMLEQLVNLGFSDANLNDVDTGNNSSALFLETTVADYQENQVDENGVAGTANGIYTRTWNIWDRTDLVNPATRKDIAVIISWQDSNGISRKVAISTIKSN